MAFSYATVLSGTKEAASGGSVVGSLLWRCGAFTTGTNNPGQGPITMVSQP